MMSNTKLALDVISDLRALAGSIETLVQAVESNETMCESKASVVPEKETKKLKTTGRAKEEALDEKQLTLEEVRAVLADKNREGHREKVKAIIVKYGANKLTELDPKHYSKVLEEVGELK